MTVSSDRIDSILGSQAEAEMGWDLTQLWRLLLFLCRFALEIFEDLTVFNGFTSAILHKTLVLRGRYYAGIGWRIPGMFTHSLVLLHSFLLVCLPRDFYAAIGEIVLEDDRYQFHEWDSH